MKNFKIHVLVAAVFIILAFNMLVSFAAHKLCGAEMIPTQLGLLVVEICLLSYGKETLHDNRQD